jgi:hypothetical protein
MGAGDVVIFCHPNETDLHAVCGIRELFGHTSGLHTNFMKCSISPIEEEANGAAVVMECQLAPYPVKYMDILLSGEAFQPVVDRITYKLPG